MQTEWKAFAGNDHEVLAGFNFRPQSESHFVTMLMSNWKAMDMMG